MPAATLGPTTPVISQFRRASLSPLFSASGPDGAAGIQPSGEAGAPPTVLGASPGWGGAVGAPPGVAGMDTMTRTSLTLSRN